MSEMEDHGKTATPEITPEMIAAGAYVLSDVLDIGPYTARRLALEVYRVMANLQQSETTAEKGA